MRQRLDERRAPDSASLAVADARLSSDSDHKDGFCGGVIFDDFDIPT
jgi:hypothetical protein